MKTCNPWMIMCGVVLLIAALYLLPGSGGWAFGGGAFALLMLICCVGPMLYILVSGTKAGCCHEKDAGSGTEGSGETEPGKRAQNEKRCH